MLHDNKTVLITKHAVSITLATASRPAPDDVGVFEGSYGKSMSERNLGPKPLSDL